MTPWVKEPAAEPSDPSLVSEASVVEGEKQPLQVVLWLPQEHHGAHAHTHIRKI